MMDAKASRTHCGRYVVRVIERSSRALARRSRIIGGPGLPVVLAAAYEEGSEQQCQCDKSMSHPTRHYRVVSHQLSAPHAARCVACHGGCASCWRDDSVSGEWLL